MLLWFEVPWDGNGVQHASDVAQARAQLLGMSYKYSSVQVDDAATRMAQACARTCVVALLPTPSKHARGVGRSTPVLFCRFGPRVLSNSPLRPPPALAR